MKPATKPFPKNLHLIVLYCTYRDSFSNLTCASGLHDTSLLIASAILNLHYILSYPFMYDTFEVARKLAGMCVSV